MKLNCRKNRRLTQMERWALDAARGVTQGPKGGSEIPSIYEYNLAITKNQLAGQLIHLD